MMKIDLGCGNRSLKGFTRVDIRPEVYPDFFIDFAKKKKWNIMNNKYDFVNCDHVFEHLNEIDFMLGEIVRISKNEAGFHFSFPHYGNAPIEPDHRGRWGLHVLSLHKEFIVEKIRLEWSPRKNKSFLYRGFNRLVSWFANLNPYLWERMFCYEFGGFSEVVLQGVIKK